MLAADLLPYVGGLAPLFGAVARALAPGGVFAFSAERHDGDGFVLGETVRYRHSAGAIAEAGVAAGLTVLLLDPASLRREARPAGSGPDRPAGAARGHRAVDPAAGRQWQHAARGLMDAPPAERYRRGAQTYPGSGATRPRRGPSIIREPDQDQHHAAEPHRPERLAEDQRAPNSVPDTGTSSENGAAVAAG